jgi:hypothetical protein
MTYVLQHPSQGLFFVGQADGDIVGAGATPSQDRLMGHDGLDIFSFQRGDGADTVVGFEQGVDVLQIAGSIRQTSLKVTDAGTEVYFGRFGQGGPDHFLVEGVFDLRLSDFLFA